MHTHTDSAKSDRISIRLEPEIKVRIEQAAAMDHRSLTSFIIASAAAMAEQILKRGDQMALSEQDWNTFYNALVHPPKANATLKKAFASYNSMNIASDV